MDLKNISGEMLLQMLKAKHPLSITMRLHPERAAVFQRCGSPDDTAACIRAGAAEIFFENQQMCMTERWLLEKDDPDTLLMLRDIRRAYPMKYGDKEYLIAEDENGTKFRYSFAVGQKQVFRISILLDKIRKASPNCQVKDRP